MSTSTFRQGHLAEAGKPLPLTKDNDRLQDGSKEAQTEVRQWADRWSRVPVAASIVVSAERGAADLGTVAWEWETSPAAFDAACSISGGRFGHFFQPWREKERSRDCCEDLTLIQRKQTSIRVAAIHHQQLARVLAATVPCPGFDSTARANSIRASGGLLSYPSVASQAKAVIRASVISKDRYLENVLPAGLEDLIKSGQITSTENAESAELPSGRAGGSLAQVCPSEPLHLAIGRRVVTVVTTASLPWLTGTAVNPLLRAIAIEKHHNALVTLMVPWLDVPDQKKLYPPNTYFSTPSDQEKYVRTWLKERLNVQPKFRILFYPAFFDEFKCGVFARASVDFTQIVPQAEADVVVLEEPEHLSWHHFGHRWKERFRLVVGVAHTNYQEYLRRQAGRALPLLIPLMWLVNILLVRAHCHKVLRLSKGVQYFLDSEVCNVHGVGDHFLKIGEEGWEAPADVSSEAPRSSQRCYFIGRMIWGKGWHELLHLLLAQQEKGRAPPARAPKTPSLLRRLCLNVLSALSLRTETGRRVKWLADSKSLLERIKSKATADSKKDEAHREEGSCDRSLSAGCQCSRGGGKGGPNFGHSIKPSHVSEKPPGVHCEGVESSPQFKKCHSSKGELGFGGAEKPGGGELWVDCYGSGPHEEEVRQFAEDHKLPCTFFGRKEHGDPLLYKYKVYVNPAVSDVICTATAEALAMGKIVVIAEHPSNEFFAENFPQNCITFPVNDSDAFCAAVEAALARDPVPLQIEQRRLLTWEAATERFMAAAGL